MKFILKYNNTCRGSLVLHSYQDSLNRFNSSEEVEDVSKCNSPTSPLKKEIKKKPASLHDISVYQI
jgi:hypothetical protein